MKQRDVKIGQVYLTKITPHVDLQEVVVVDQIQDSFSGRIRFRIRRNLSGTSVLPKSRAASALHELPVSPQPVTLEASSVTMVDSETPC